MPTLPSEPLPATVPEIADICDIREVRKSSLGAAAPFASCIFEVLRADHQAIAAVFAQLQQELANDKPDEKICLDLFQKIDAILSPHAHTEEELTYRAFASLSKEAEAAVAEAFEEHALIHTLCAELRARPKVNAFWHAKARVLMSVVELHNQKEDALRFALARKLVDRDESSALAAEYLSTKEQITAKLGFPPLETLELPPIAPAQLAAS